MCADDCVRVYFADLSARAGGGGAVEAADLAAGSVISGGMLPKLQACGLALKHGVGRVRILPAAKADVLPQFYLTKLTCGTEVTCA